MFQSTRPQGARPINRTSQRINELVSIHAPAGGATGRLALVLIVEFEFQSTRPQGARLIEVAKVQYLSKCFNPRARRGRDLFLRCYFVTRMGFNPRARRGRDWRFAARIPMPTKFQSTRPQGARRGKSHPTIIRFLFQSTRPQGARLHHPLHAVLLEIVSIHAPAGGATNGGLTYFLWQHGFQSTRPQGARLRKLRGGRKGRVVSIHAPAGGATLCLHHRFQQLGVSIHAPAGGATQ